MAYGQNVPSCDPFKGQYFHNVQGHEMNFMGLARLKPFTVYYCVVLGDEEQNFKFQHSHWRV